MLFRSGAQVYVLRGSGALAGNKLAQELAATRSMAEAEAITLAVCGRCELDYERQKATTLPLQKPEAVNLYEAPASGNYWAASSVSGLLIHAVVGSLGGWGSLRTNRSGWAA